VLLRRVEEASLNAWPALEQVLYDGWVLRFSRGYTRRANSVNPLYEGSIDAIHKVEQCEKQYQAKGLRTVFRITPFATPPELDRFLAQRGYAREAPTQVIGLDLATIAQRVPPELELRDETLSDWISAFCRLRRNSVEEHRTHAQMLEAIPTARMLGTLVEGEQPVACGVGVVEGAYLGLFDLIADPARRRQGLGTQLVLSLLRWGVENDARYAYLGVMDENVPARGLYAKLGFHELYPYWYRVRE